MKFLITGGAGFLGSPLVIELAKKRNNEIYVFDSFAYGYPEKLPKRKNIKDFIVGNIKDYYAVCRTMEKVQPDIVIHLAAHVTRPESLGEFRVCAEVNHLGTANLLQACTLEGSRPKKIIFASSGAVRNPYSHYGISKLAAEKLLESVCPLLGVDLCVLRFSEIYGLSKSQSSKSLINFLVDNMVVGQSVALFDVNKEQDHIHISDAVRACMLAIDSKEHFFNVDIGTGKGISSKRLVEKIKDLMKFEGQIKFLEHPGVRVVESIADPVPAKDILGFESEMDFDIGLKELVTKRRKALR